MQAIQREEQEAGQGSTVGPQGTETRSTTEAAPSEVPSLPLPPRHIRRPWEKLAKKIERKTGLALPPMLLPLLARIEKEHRRRGIAEGLDLRAVIQVSQLDFATVQELVRAQILHITKAPSELIRADRPMPHALQLHPRLAELLGPMLDETDAAIAWGIAAIQQGPL